MTFSKDANGNVNMNVYNKGSTFIIGAAAGYHGLSSAEDCIGIDAARIPLLVPGNGIINNGTAVNK